MLLALPRVFVWSFTRRTTRWNPLLQVSRCMRNAVPKGILPHICHPPCYVHLKCTPVGRDWWTWKSSPRHGEARGASSLGGCTPGSPGSRPAYPPKRFRFAGEDCEKLCPARIQHPLGGAGASQAKNVQVFVKVLILGVYTPGPSTPALRLGIGFAEIKRTPGWVWCAISMRGWRWRRRALQSRPTRSRSLPKPSGSAATTPTPCCAGGSSRLCRRGRAGSSPLGQWSTGWRGTKTRKPPPGVVRSWSVSRMTALS
jgi:hypothetical protein